MRSTFLILGCVAALASSAAHAQRVYKCVDANGKTMYSTEPCPSGATASMLKIDPAPSAKPAGKAAASKPAPTPEGEFQKRRQEREEAEKQAAKNTADKQEAQENCVRARGTLAQLETGRVARIDASGDRRFLDDDQLAAEKSRARGLIQEWCK
jgi:hypothetical protein